MTRQIEILTRYRDEWNAAADRYLRWAEHAERRSNAEEVASYQRLAVMNRGYAWKAQADINRLLGNDRREAA